MSQHSSPPSTLPTTSSSIPALTPKPLPKGLSFRKLVPTTSENPSTSSSNSAASSNPAPPLHGATMPGVKSSRENFFRSVSTRSGDANVGLNSSPLKLPGAIKTAARKLTDPLSRSGAIKPAAELFQPSLERIGAIKPAAGRSAIPSQGRYASQLVQENSSCPTIVNSPSNAEVQPNPSETSLAVSSSSVNLFSTPRLSIFAGYDHPLTYLF